MILCGVTIGRRTIIGADSVITHDIPDEIVACGTPAVGQGTPNDFRQRFEEAMTQPGPYQYWNFLPWRGRKQALTNEEIKRSKQEFFLKFRKELTPLLTNYPRQITP